MRLREPLLPPGLPARPSIALPLDVAPVVHEALLRRPHGQAVVCFREGCIEVEDRDGLVQFYRRHGLREIVAKLRGALVPAGFVLALVDLERGTRVILVSHADLFGGIA